MLRASAIVSAYDQLPAELTSCLRRKCNANTRMCAHKIFFSRFAEPENVMKPNEDVLESEVALTTLLNEQGS